MQRVPQYAPHGQLPALGIKTAIGSRRYPDESMVTTTTEAAERVRRAADTLHAAVYPGDELRGSREDVRPEAVAAVDRILALLSKAEYAYAPGIGKPDVEKGTRLVEVASDELEAQLPAWLLPNDLRTPRAYALRDLDAITGRS